MNREIAQLLAINEAAANKRYIRALQRLRRGAFTRRADPAGHGTSPPTGRNRAGLVARLLLQAVQTGTKNRGCHRNSGSSQESTARCDSALPQGVAPQDVN